MNANKSTDKKTQLVHISHTEIKGLCKVGEQRELREAFFESSDLWVKGSTFENIYFKHCLFL